MRRKLWKKQVYGILAILMAAVLACSMAGMPSLAASIPAEILQEGNTEDTSRELLQEPADEESVDEEAAGEGTAAEISAAEPAGGAEEEEEAHQQEELLIEEELSVVSYQSGGLDSDETASQALDGSVMDALAAGMRERQAEIDISAYGVERDAFAELYAMVLNYNPDLFYVMGVCGYSRNLNNIVVRVRPVYDQDYTEADSRKYRLAVEEAYAQAVPEPEKMTDLQKAMALHDYLVQHMEYDLSLSRFNAYHALVEKTAVCQGYALAYAELLKKAGISFDFCTSIAMNHMWNYVQIDGKWYHVDATWDDPTKDRLGYASHQYFMLSDGQMGREGTKGHHSWNAARACEDPSYDNAYWQDASSAVIYIGETAYYLKGDHKETSLFCRKQDTEEKLCSVKDTWTVWGSSAGSYWPGSYSRLSCYGSKLFFNDKTHIYQYDPKTAEFGTVYTYKEKDGYLYGSIVYDGCIVLAVALDPNMEAARKTVPLPDGFVPDPVMYTVTFDKNDGSSVESLQVAENETVPLPEPPVREGYLFKGWYFNKELYDFAQPVTQDLVLTAEWEGEELAVYVVVFDSQGGNAVESQQVSENGQASCPKEPVRAGYRFRGWYLNGELYDFARPVTQDLLLCAKWSREEEEEPAEEIPGQDIPDEGIPQGFWVAGNTDQTYTGKAIKPQIRVYDGEKRLIAGKDYTVSYKNNINVNDSLDPKSAACILIKGRGSYSGTRAVAFRILGKNITDDDMACSFTDAYAYQSGKTQNIQFSIKYGNKVLKRGKDYDVFYEDSQGHAVGKVMDAGEYKMFVKGKGSYSGELELAFSVSDKVPVSRLKIAKISGVHYDGTPKTPAMTVKDGTKLLEKDKDYTIRWQNNTDAGTASARLTGKGGYAGSRTVYFKILGTSVKKAAVNGLRAMPYTGKPIVQSLLQLEIKKTSATLEAGKDYTVSYSNNTDAGKAVLLITGMGGYSGTVKKTFPINAFDLGRNKGGRAYLSDTAIQVPYAKGGAKPDVELYYDGRRLKQGTDYTLSYVNNQAVGGTGGTPMVIAKGKGNFCGSLSPVPFTILPQTLSQMRMEAEDTVFKPAAGNGRTKVVLYDLDGRKLSAGKDYEKELVYTYVSDTVLEDGTNRQAGSEVESQDIIPPGTSICVKAEGKGNYRGVKRAYFRVAGAVLKGAKVTWNKKFTCTGKPVTLEKEDFTVAVKGSVLTTDEYEILEDTYQNNRQPGTASVCIRGKDAWGGTLLLKYKIMSKGL